MTKHEVKIGDEIEWQGHSRKVTKIVSVCVLLDGVDDVIALPVEATSVSVGQFAYATPKQLKRAGLSGANAKYRPGGVMDQIFGFSGKGQDDA